MSVEALPLRYWYYNIPGFWNLEYWVIIPMLSLLIIIAAAFYLYIEEPIRNYLNS